MKNILLIVDVQKGFARKDSTITLVDKIKTLLQQEIFDVVIATRFLNNDYSIYKQLFGWDKLKTENEREIIPCIKEHVDYVFDKFIYNCVNSNFIQKVCQMNEGKYPEKIFIVGADTDCCVLTIATSLFECNIRPVILTKYCDSNGGFESHQAGLICLRRLIGERQLIDEEIDLNTNLDVL